MKKVFKNAAECIHIFAQQTQTEGRSSNVFFESNGKKLYSYGYHYLLAEFIKDDVIYINDKGYSNTTAKHISVVTMATRQYKQVFYKQSAPYILSELKTIYQKLIKAKKPEIYINRAQRLNLDLQKFCELTKGTYLSPKKEDLKECKALIKKILMLSNKEALQEYSKKQTEIILKKVKREKAIFDKYISLWVQNKDEEASEFLKKNNVVKAGEEDFLRIRGEFIETTQGVKIPLIEAKELYLNIVNGKDISGYKLGHYTIESINGVLKAGCHRINIDNVHSTGRALMEMQF